MNQTFSELGLNPERVAGLEAQGYEQPSKLQAEVIPQMLAGRDLVVEAAPGSGKTIAFVLPILQTLNYQTEGVQALILTPSGEDAIRVTEHFQALSQNPNLHVVPVFEGQPIARESGRLSPTTRVVVGTPKRVQEHLVRGSLDLDQLQFVALDGADEMLEEKQQASIEEIMDQAPAGRQTILFASQLEPSLQGLADQYLFEPIIVKRGAMGVAMPVLKHRYQGMMTEEKDSALLRLLDGENIDRSMVHVNLRPTAEHVARILAAQGYMVRALHSATPADAIESAVRGWSDEHIDFLVITDRVASNLSLETPFAISYDVPTDAENYAARGRLVAENGTLFTLVIPRERKLLREIENFTGQRVKAVLPPTRADAVTQRAETFRQKLREVMTNTNLEVYMLLLNDLAEEGFDWAEIAAAAVRLLQHTQSDTIFTRKTESPRPASAPRPTERREHAARPQREEDREVEAGYVRLTMDAGYDIGVRPKDIVGAIANEANIPGRAVGNIDIRDSFTYIEVQNEYIDRVLTRVPTTRLRGRIVSFRRA